MLDQNAQKRTRRIFDPSIPASPALSIDISPDGQTALTSAFDFFLRQWDLKEGICQRVWNANGPLFSIKIISSGKTALLAAVQGVVSWDLDRWELSSPNTFWSHTAILDLDYSEKREEVWGAGENALIYRWKISGTEKLKPLRGHESMLTALALDKTGKFALSGDLYGRLKLWDSESGLCLKTWQGHEEKIASIQISPDGNYAASAGQDKNVHIWSFPKGDFYRKFDNQGFYVNRVIFSPDERLVFIGGDGGLRIHELGSSKIVAEIKLKHLADFRLLPDGTGLVTLLRGNELLVWDFA